MDKLAARLTALGYDRLFLSDDRELNAIWAESAGALEGLALGEGAQLPAQARFLAAEVLFRKRPGAFPPQAQEVRAALGRTYAAALRTAKEANPWGMPGKLDEPVGQHMVALGEPAAAALLPLLTDTTPVPYGGSQEATLGNRYAYRVKDLAAFLLAKIRGVPYEVKLLPAERDVEIARLR